jgi:hypothetical protein
MTTETHSPLPWTIGGKYDNEVVDANGYPVVRLPYCSTANLIVAAVNQHAELAAELADARAEVTKLTEENATLHRLFATAKRERDDRTTLLAQIRLSRSYEVAQRDALRAVYDTAVALYKAEWTAGITDTDSAVNTKAFVNLKTAITAALDAAKD